MPGDWPVKEARDYVRDARLAEFLTAARRQVLSDPRARPGTTVTSAFDLYVTTGRMYRSLRQRAYRALKEELTRPGSPIEWFFVSDAYGVAHALEAVTAYEASFSYQVAQRQDIPYTGPTWEPALSEITAHIVDANRDLPVYAFGSPTYTRFIKESLRWGLGERVKVFEGTGSGGAAWLSPRLLAFVRALLGGRLDEFDRRYPGPLQRQSKQGPAPD